jgi:hypothetical protein
MLESEDMNVLGASKTRMIYHDVSKIQRYLFFSSTYKTDVGIK